jgi:hypothetical protein
MADFSLAAVAAVIVTIDAQGQGGADVKKPRHAGAFS